MNTQIALMAGLAAILFGGVYLWLRDSVRKFDRTYGDTYTRPPGE